ncbi:MAG TPA: hypothetical protein EYP60_04650 [bacterium (Candidatus Stahlbacteria)]|nr:hypothetical protein [Candidatus Stahlbacteria bacterium]
MATRRLPAVTRLNPITVMRFNPLAPDLTELANCTPSMKQPIAIKLASITTRIVKVVTSTAPDG